MSDEEILASMEAQAATITEALAEKFLEAEPDSQIVALIAYLQKLGTWEDVSAAQARREAAGLHVAE